MHIPKLQTLSFRVVRPFLELCVVSDLTLNLPRHGTCKTHSYQCEPSLFPQVALKIYKKNSIFIVGKGTDSDNVLGRHR